MAVNGSTILLAVETSPTVFDVIPCQTSGEYSLSVDTLDTSCKDSADSQNQPGNRERTLSVETLPTAWPELSLSPTGVEQVIRDAAENGQQVTGQVLASGTPAEEFTATITSYSLSAGREESVTNSIELMVSGPMVPV